MFKDLKNRFRFNLISKIKRLIQNLATLCYVGFSYLNQAATVLVAAV